MNYDPLQPFSRAEHSASSEPTVLLSPVTQTGAAGLFTSANMGHLPELTQPMRWQLPEERRLRVVRGGLRRDWRASAHVMGGLLLIALLMLTLSLWPAHARPEAVSKIPAETPASMSANSALAVPYAAAGERSWTPSAHRPSSQQYRTMSAYRRLHLPVPGLPDAYLSQSTYFGGANNRDDGYYTVPPAAPIGISPAVPHYSY